MRLTTYLFITLAVLIATTIVVGQFKTAFAGQANRTATEIRKAGHR